MMGGFGGGMGGWGMGLGWIVPLLLIGLVVWAVVALVRSRTGDQGDAADRSLAILKERYARGELDEETYRRMRRELEA